MNYNSFYLCEIDVRTPTSFWYSYKLLNSNLVSKLVSSASEWIVLSFDIPYYTELPHILQNGDWKLGQYAP